jgi:hypothetical protein
LKITRRKFIGLAASVAILPSGLLVREFGSPSSDVRKLSPPGAKPSQAKISRRVYLDESGNATARFVVAGCLAVDARRAKQVKLRLEESFASDWSPKWNRLSRLTLEPCRNMLTAVFDAVERGELSFDYVIAKNKYTQISSHESLTGYSEAAHRLLLAYSAPRRDTHKLYVYPQRRGVGGSLENYRRVLNSQLFKDAKNSIPIRLIEYRDSRDSIFSQALDVIVGALAYRANGFDSRAGAGAAKRELAALVAGRIAAIPQLSV